MIDAPMTAREEAFKASHAEMLAALLALDAVGYLKHSLCATIEGNAAMEQARNAITNAERVA